MKSDYETLIEASRRGEHEIVADYARREAHAHPSDSFAAILYRAAHRSIDALLIERKREWQAEVDRGGRD